MTITAKYEDGVFARDAGSPPHQAQNRRLAETSAPWLVSWGSSSLSWNAGLWYTVPAGTDGVRRGDLSLVTAPAAAPHHPSPKITGNPELLWKLRPQWWVSLQQESRSDAAPAYRTNPRTKW